MTNSRFSPSREIKPGLKLILVLNLAVFLLGKLPGFEALVGELVLHPLSISIWQNITYMFVHADFTHLLFNCLGIYFVGSSLENKLGTQTFLRFFLLCGVGGALATHLVAMFGYGGITLGASGALFGLLYACYIFYPDAIVYIYFVIPVKLKWALIIFGGFDLIMLFEGDSSVAHYAHLGGLLTSFIYFKYGGIVTTWQNQQEIKKEVKAYEKMEDIKAKVDQLLAKISKNGIGSLTSKEKSFLKKSSQNFVKEQSQK